MEGPASYLRVSHNVEQSNDIGPACQVLQDLDLALYLLLLDGLEHLDDAFLVVDNIDAFEHLGVFAATWVGGGRSAKGATDELGHGDKPIFLTTS